MIRHAQTSCRRQYTDKPTKRCSTSLTIKEMLIKPQWDITTHLSEWLKKKIVTPNTGKDAEKLYTLLVGMYNGIATLEKFDSFFKN